MRAVPDLLPSEQVTVAVALPAPVLPPIFHVQETWPEASATGRGLSPVAVETVPEAYLTLARHVAPGELAAASVTLELGSTDAGRLVIWTGRAAGGGGGGAAVFLMVGATVGAGEAVAVSSDSSVGDGDGTRLGEGLGDRDRVGAVVGARVGASVAV